ncbi:MAG: glycoside hydrolase family 27 protein [bacterium]|nr:glycoside hydrolase family 27 protein [bacterium]
MQRRRFLMGMAAAPLLWHANDARALDNGLALTPPMGWNSWNCFRAEIDEEKILSIAEAMVSSGMKDAGYEYVILDDGWQTAERDSGGRIQPNSVKFPGGMNALSDSIHALGLKFGIYSSPSYTSCEGLMGSRGHEQRDADDFAAWGVDYLKYDWCKFEGSEAECRAAFELMRDCLAKTGRPIVYSAHDKCTEGSESGGLPWIREVANLHRVSPDIKDDWNRMLECIDAGVELYEFAGPGYWNDPDMLEVGSFGKDLTERFTRRGYRAMTLNEYRTHFSLWCIASAPLIAGNDLRCMPPDIAAILTNPGAVAINQDPLGAQGRPVKTRDGVQLWFKPKSGERSCAALAVNRGDETASFSLDLEALLLGPGRYAARDVWTGETFALDAEGLALNGIEPHGCVLLSIEPAE